MMAAADARLFPDAGERERLNDRLTRALSRSAARVRQGSVTPCQDTTDFAEELFCFDFAEAIGIDEAIGWILDALERGLMHVPHPRYLGLFNPAPSFPSECADRIVSVFNPQLASASTSPAAIAIEQHTISTIARRADLDANTGGHFTSGGPEANATALMCALTRACPDFARHGARTFPGAPTFCVSRESHLARIKIAHGIERADSFTLDAHNWFATSMASGMFVTAHAGLLPQVFGVTSALMPCGTVGSGDPYCTSIQWSRR